MTMRIPEEITTWLNDWSLVATDLNMPPRDPNDDDDEEEEEDDEDEEDPAVIREPDE